MSDYHIPSETRQLKFNQQRQKMKDNMAKKHVQQIKSIQSSDNNHSKLSLKFTLLKDNYSPLLSEENNNHEKVNKSKFAYDGPQTFELKDLENDEGSEIEVVHLGDEVVPVKSSTIDNIMSLESHQYDDMEEIKETVIPSNFEYSTFGFEEKEYDGNNHGEEEDWNILKSKNSSDTLNSQLHFSSELLTNTEQRDNHFNDSISGSLNTSGVAVAPCATDSPRNNTDSINYVESFPVENDRFDLQLFNNFIDAPLEIEKFVTSPAPENCIIHCRISRDKRGVDKGMFPIYYLHLERNNAKPMFLLAARRRKMSKTSNYLISCDPTDMTRDGFGFLAKLRSNFVGTQFSIFDNGESPGSRRDIDKPIRKELAAAIYESNVLGFKGPRRMTIIIPGMTTEKVALDFSPGEHEDGLIECWKKRNMNKLLELHNKKPVWNDDSQSYVLNFHGRVTQASVKNFQIVHDNDVDYIVMQFGRTSDHSFSMDYSYPLSAVQAFGIALSSFDGKLACE